MPARHLIFLLRGCKQLRRDAATEELRWVAFQIAGNLKGSFILPTSIAAVLSQTVQPALAATDNNLGMFTTVADLFV